MSQNKFFIGQESSLEKFISTEDVLHFSTISGDSNPVHLDDEYAFNTIFKKRIVHGFLVGSLISAVIGTQMPGIGTIYLSQTMKFVKPVFVDQLVKAVVTIKEINIEKSIMTLQTECLKHDNNEWILVLTGEAVVKYS